MKRRRYIQTVGAGATTGLAALAGCGAPGGQTDGDAETTGAGGGTETGTGGETTTGGTTTGGQQIPNRIAMVTEGSEYYFDPIGLFVESGETITWVNEAGAHSSTAYTEDNPQSEARRIPDDAEGWNSGTLSEEGGEFTHTFDVAGTYDYYCIPHKTLGMVGRLVVDEPSGLEGDPPDGPVPAEQAIVEQGAVTYEEFQSQS